MKSGLFLPRFNGTDVVQGDRVDEHIRLITSQINGGLTLHNLSPSLKLGTGYFAEKGNLFCMTGKFESTFNDGQGPSVCVGATSAANANLCGISLACALPTANFNASNPNNYITIFSGDGSQLGVYAYLSMVVPPPVLVEEKLFGGDYLFLAGYQYIQHESAIPAGMPFHVMFVPAVVGAFGTVTLWFKQLHTS